MTTKAPSESLIGSTSYRAHLLAQYLAKLTPSESRPMKCTATLLLFLTLSITPICTLADNWPGGMSLLPGTSFATIYRDGKGRYIAQLPSDKTIEISSTCGTSKPLWLYGSSRPGKCLAVMPSRVVDTGIIELQVTFTSNKDKKIMLLSTRSISNTKSVTREPDANELASLFNHLGHATIKERLIKQIKSVSLDDHKIIYFIPVEQLDDPNNDLVDRACTRLKTLVLLQNEKRFTELGSLDNMPEDLIDNQTVSAPIALTYSSCKTVASLWVIYPKVKNVANFFNGIGG
jgi:hypothetical protein